MVFERISPLFTGLQSSTGVPANQWADHIGGETAGYILNMVLNATTPKSALNILTKVLVGLGTSLAGAFAAGISADDRRALVQWGATNLLGAIDTLVDPEGFNKVAQSFNQFMNQLASGDILGALASQFNMAPPAPPAYAPPAAYIPPPPAVNVQPQSAPSQPSASIL